VHEMQPSVQGWRPEYSGHGHHVVVHLAAHACPTMERPADIGPGSSWSVPRSAAALSRPWPAVIAICETHSHNRLCMHQLLIRTLFLTGRRCCPAGPRDTHDGWLQQQVRGEGAHRTTQNVTPPEPMQTSCLRQQLLPAHLN
jgi:hypothetical protein